MHEISGSTSRRPIPSRWITRTVTVAVLAFAAFIGLGAVPAELPSGTSTARAAGFFSILSSRPRMPHGSTSAATWRAFAATTAGQASSGCRLRPYRTAPSWARCPWTRRIATICLRSCAAATAGGSCARSMAV